MGNVLLEMQISVACQENIKARINNTLQKVAVFQAFPGIRKVRDVVPEIAQHRDSAARHAFIDDRSQAAIGPNRRFSPSEAICRTASACSRSTVGKSSRNSCREVPPARFSNRASTGTRVPLNTTAPDITSGSVLSTSLIFIPASILR